MSVLTILPGEPMYSAFGHTAIRVRDDSLGIDAVYNFGTFDFDTDWFYFKFARGLLDYRLARNRFQDILSAYTREARPIIEQRLAFDEQERQILVLRLEDNYLPKNRFYRYDFFFDNCSTRPRDVIESVAGDRSLGADLTGGSTFRDLIDPYISPRPWTHFGIDILLGSLTDHPATNRQRLFLPVELMVALDSASIDGESLVARTDTLFWPRGYRRASAAPPFSSEFDKSPSGMLGRMSGGMLGALFGTLFSPLFILVALLAFGVAVIFTPMKERDAIRYFDAVLFLTAGAAGIIILFLWFGSQHTVTGENWHILWALPTNLLAAVALFRDRVTAWTRAYFWAASIACACLLAGWAVIGQDLHLAVIPLAVLLLVRAAYRARFVKRISGCLLLLMMTSGVIETSSAQPQRRPIRDLGVHPGVLEAGPHNAITDVDGVQVGHFTLDQGDSVRTGATAILPHGENLYRQKVPAAIVVGNGFGKLTGMTQVKELGEIETPIILTNTLSVPRAVDAVIEYTLGQTGNENVRSVNAVVGETNDGFLNDIRARVLQPKHVLEAIASASSDPPEQGSVGAGRGTRAFGWKGGIGTSSRILPHSLGGYTIGVLVQSNYGGILHIMGSPVGQELGRYYLKDTVEESSETDDSGPDGSIMIVVATDAPLSDRNLNRLAVRALAGLARTGSSMSNGSGDYVIAFSTAESVRRTPDRRRESSFVEDLPNNRMSPLFQAVIEATEEAIYNSLFLATTVSGHRGTVESLPLDVVSKILSRAAE